MKPRILLTYPPNYTTLRREFGAESVRGAVFAFGDVIYNPYKLDLGPDLIAHEREHCVAQMKVGTALWWESYIRDRDFRLTEELLGHRAEYAYWRDVMKLKGDKLHQALDRIAQRLSGPLYANMISLSDARGEISR